MGTKVIVQSEHDSTRIVHEDGCCIELSECCQHLIVKDSDQKVIGIYPSGFYATVVTKPELGTTVNPNDGLQDVIDRMKNPSRICPGIMYPYPPTLPSQDQTGPAPFPNQPMCGSQNIEPHPPYTVQDVFLCERSNPCNVNPCCQKFPCEFADIQNNQFVGDGK